MLVEVFLAFFTDWVSPETFSVVNDSAPKPEEIPLTTMANTLSITNRFFSVRKIYPFLSFSEPPKVN